MPLNIRFDNTYARDLNGMYAPWQAAPTPHPSLVWLNLALAQQLGLSPDELQSDLGVAMLAGNHAPAGAQPLAQAYAGHQFGHFSPQLGDGRALLLGEVIDTRGQRQDMAFKGSGPTPFSRRGDGLASLSSVLREVLISEAMHALGVPTTRALAAVATGQTIQRERRLLGGILTRVAASHLRVGTFEYFAAREDMAALRRLTDYAIDRHDAELTGEPDAILRFFKNVVDRQAKLVAQWLGLGFIHGVMNTDNMTISGETIDFGPCAFMEAYDPATVFSSIDAQGRYAYGNQVGIAKWNLSRLASALLPLIDEDEAHATALAIEALNTFDTQFTQHSQTIWRTKLGLQQHAVEAATSDKTLAQDFLQLMQQQQIDFTQGWRVLALTVQDRQLFYTVFTQTDATEQWLSRWQQRGMLETATPVMRSAAIKQASPVHIPRNHLVEEALTEATENKNTAPFNALMRAITQPFDDTGIAAKFSQPAPAEVTANYQTFCGT
ncbi:MAG TPA: YdiU family protein [Burkholderiaceae bacterium]|nr:YdiU family protein [Burkholderiaceae bacterium]